MAHQLIRGTIRYTSNKPERLGQERGREYFTLTFQGDGRKQLNAHCEIDDPPAVMRDVTLAYDAGWAPQQCSVFLNVGGKFMGAGWFDLAEPGLVTCETHTAQEGRISQRMRTEGPAQAFGAHPIAGDAWYLPAYDLAQGPGKQRLERVFLSSPDHRGATGPLLFRLSLSLVFVGKERVEVAAGSFDALHFQFTDTGAGGLPEEHPPYNIWVTDDGRYIFLKGQVDGYMMTFYELTELEIR